jgi:thioredoxin 1
MILLIRFRGDIAVDYPDKPIELTDANFDENVKKYSFFVVDNWAPWCPPCLMLSPIIESLAKKYVGKIVFGKLNVDENKEVAQKYEVMSVPTLLVLKKGKLVDRIVGAMPEPLLEKRLKSFL